MLSDSFAEIVKREREAKGLSKSVLGAKAGLHQTYVGLLESKQRSPNLDTAKAIADALGLKLSVMLAEIEK